MADLSLLLTYWSSIYAAAGVGILLALLLRQLTCSTPKSDTSLSAETLAFLPIISAFVFLGLLCLPVSFALHQSIHLEWHRWMGRLPENPAVHLSLHVANGAFLLFALTCVGRSLYTVSRLHAFARGVRSLAPIRRIRNGILFNTIESEGFHSFTAGTFRPQIFVSRGLLERLTPEEAAAMLAHEQCHLGRRDGLKATILTLFYLLFPLPGSRALFQDWAAAAERACDAYAARGAGGPHLVASTLIRVAGLVQKPTIPAIGFALSSVEDLEGRVHALLTFNESPPAWTNRDTVLPALALLACLGMIGSACPILSHAVQAFVHH